MKPEKRIGRAKKIRRELGGSENLWTAFPEKPMTMHYERYTRLKLEDRKIRHDLLTRGEE